MKVTAIVPAAGTGERMQSGVKKPYVRLLQRPILSYVLEVLGQNPYVGTIIVPVYPGEEPFCRENVVGPLCLDAEVIIIAGGRMRQESVRKALDAAPASSDTVLIHDGARPLVTADLVAAAISATRHHSAATLAVPVKDSITRVSPDSRTIVQTVPRHDLFAVQTPQAFHRDIIVDAHRAAAGDAFIGTDDASLIERRGVPVAVVRGSYTNIKITTPEDLLFAEAVLAGRQQLA